jgi:hypothetical protein
MTFDPVSSQTDPAESERYIEGTIARTGTVFALNNISYGGGISSLADEGSLSGTVIETQDNDGGTVRVVHFVFESITGIDPDVDRPNIKQWLRASSTANWEPNSEYRSDDASSSTVERKSAVIYLVLDCSNSLDSSQISQIRNATINFIDSLYTQYNAGLDPSQVGATTTVLSPGVWANGNISQYGQTKRYTFNVTAGTEYSIWWNDSAAGNSTKTLDIQVSAKYNGQTSDIFSNADSAWSTPQTFTPTANGQVIVTVQAGYYYYTGDYAIAYNWSGVNPSVPALSLTGTVSVTGAAPLGETLTADTTNLGGSGTIGYQWNRRTTETGADTAIAGATGSTYIPVVADAGKYITLTVTRIGRVGSVTSNTTAIPAISEITGAVSISGGAYIGGTLTADTASLGGSGTIGYQWNRRTTETGADTAIPGATGSTYIPVTDDAGKYITVTVTRILSTGSVTSNVTAAVTEPPCTLSWSGDWIQSSDNVYYSNSIGDNDSTLQTLSIITSTAAGCSITVTLTASSESGCDYGYASVLDGSASTSSYQLRVSGSSSNSYTYTVPAGAEYVGVHHLYFRYQKDGSLTSGDDRVTVSVTVN